MSRFVIVAVTVCIAGLADAQTTAVTTTSQPESATAPYRSGYADGCQHATSGLSRNEVRFQSDAAYRDGWLKGNANCHVQLDSLQNNGDPNGPMKNPL